MAPSPQPASLPKRERIRKRGEYLAVQGRGRKFSSEHFLVLVKAPEPPRAVRAQAASPPVEAAPLTRIGLTVSKKVGCAVERNRVKRLLREVYRRHKGWFPAARDVVVIARPGAAALGYEALAREVEKLCKRHFANR